MLVVVHCHFDRLLCTAQSTRSVFQWCLLIDLGSQDDGCQSNFHWTHCCCWGVLFYVKVFLGGCILHSKYSILLLVEMLSNILHCPLLKCIMALSVWAKGFCWHQSLLQASARSLLIAMSSDWKESHWPIPWKSL